MIQTTIVGYGERRHKQLPSYITRLNHYMPEYYPGIGWKVYDERIQEATIEKYIQLVDDRVLGYHPNIIFIECTGIESDMDSKRFINVATYEEQLEVLMEKLLKHNNRTGLNNCMPIPVLITPPPLNEAYVRTNRTNNRLRQYVYIMKKVAKKYNCPVIDLFNTLIVTPEFEKHYISEDGLYLTDKGIDVLYDIAFIELTKLINYQGVLKERIMSA